MTQKRFTNWWAWGIIKGILRRYNLQKKGGNNIHLPLYLLLSILAANLIGLILCGVDKRRAQQGRWRISESALLTAGLCGGSFGLLLGMRWFRHKTKHLKFRLLVPLQCVLWSVVLIHTLSALSLDRHIQYREISYASSNVSPELDGYRIAFVTDTHSMTAQELQQVARRIDRASPDLFVLGGDFPSQGDAPLRSMEILSQVTAPDGIYGVEGNHDDAPTLFAAMESHGIIPLSNSGVPVHKGLFLAGVEDLWNRSPDITASIQNADPNDFVLLLAHNPDITMQQNTTGVDLILSGHTHGGQITLFGVIAPALSWRNTITDYGQRFQSGWAKSQDGTDIYISNGTGYLSSVPRVFARPQVILVTLRQKDAPKFR